MRRPGFDTRLMCLMIGFRRDRETSESFNIGIGVVIDPNVQTLGEGITANMPLPTGETAIRYTERMQTGLLILTD